MSLLSVMVFINFDSIESKFNRAIELIKIEVVTAQIDTIESNWNGETWNAVGDSVTEHDIYTEMIASKLGLEVNNYGLSRSTVAVNNEYMIDQSMYERVKEYPNADLWTVFGGLNDWLYQTPLGTIDSDNSITFYGALKGLVEEILNRPNNPELVLITPTQSVRNGENEIGISMNDYRKAIIDVSEMYDVSVVDLYMTSGINSGNLDMYTKDGIHPNIKGTEMYSKEIVKAITKK